MALELLTSRVQLRSWSIDDLEPLIELFAKPEVWHFPVSRSLTPAETESFLLQRIEEQRVRGWCEWAAVDRSTVG